jgi:hypothetical protein
MLGLPVLCLILFALAIIISKVIQASNVNPVNSLRNE